MNKQMGLTAKEVERARRLHGENRFTEQKKRSFLREFFAGFSDPIILILLVALGLNLFFAIGKGEYFETVGIALAILLSVFVSTLCEYRSEKAFEKLRAQANRLTCRVRREGVVRTLAATELVVGDVVLLSSGDVVPADGRIIFGALTVNQSTLNGESREANKHPDLKAQSLFDAGALFSGTTVTSGEGELCIQAVGDATLYGRLAAQLKENARKSPLKEKLGRLAKSLSKIGYCAAALVAGADLLYAVFELGGGSLAQGFLQLSSTPTALAPALLHALTLAVTVVVVAVPEGLPMMITVVLSSQMRRMLREGVLVRRLAGIETAGTMDLLFCDKTGTLTQGAHRVRHILAFDDNGLIETVPENEELYCHFVLNNQAHSENGKPKGSNATDRALLHYFAKRTHTPQQVLRRLPFESARKYSAVALSGRRLLFKGAPEVLLRCATQVKIGAHTQPLNDCRRKKLKNALARREANGERMVAFATGEGELCTEEPTALTLVFFASLSDDLRADTAQSVAHLQQAGIQVVMLTGDSELTAVSIARRAGLLKPEMQAVSSEYLRSLDDAALARLLPTLAVVYRCTPEDKSRLATLSVSLGRVCGMTGDGVNDAPALKLSDVGFAMGSGSQIAKDAADVILTDDRLSSLEHAVLYGRTVFRSIQKFITFQLTMNFCAVLVSFLGPMCGVETPITVMQMLWVNLIMDTAASLAFSGEPPRIAYLKKAPLTRNAPILSPPVKRQIAFGTLYSVGACCLFLLSEELREAYAYPQDPLPFLTAFFLLFVFLGVFNMINVRTPRQRLWAELGQNRGFVCIFFLICTIQLLLVATGVSLFRCCVLPLPLLTLPILLALSILPFDLLRKGLTKKTVDRH